MPSPLRRAAVTLSLSGLFFLAPAPSHSAPAPTEPAPAPQSATPIRGAVVLPAKTKDGKDIPPAATEREARMGEKAAAQIEKDPKLKILDPKKDEKTKALYAKLNDMAQKIGKASARPLIVYKVKVIDDKDQINAFTLPNGNVYFFTGLLNLMSSDDEIAAVMAHEIGHNAQMHYLRGDSKAKKMTWLGLAMILAAVAGGTNGANVAAFSQYAMIGVMSGWSLEFEKEADATGVAEMIGAGYNPSAMATVMQRFEVEEKRRPKVEMGIFEDHPPAGERVAAIQKQIQDAGLPFNPRAVSGAPEAVAIQEKDRVLVKMKDATLMEFAGGQSTPATIARAKQAARTLNELMRDNLKMHEIQMSEVQVGSTRAAQLSARGEEIARVLPADAALQNLSPLACAQKWRDNLRAIFWRETVNGAL